MKLEVGKCYFFKGNSPCSGQPVWTGTVVAIYDMGLSISPMVGVRYENGSQVFYYNSDNLEVVQELK